MLKQQIMRRIYAVWILKKLTSPFAMKFYVLAAVLKQVFGMVSVKHIIANSPSLLDLSASYRFASGAFFSTEFTVKVLALLFVSFSLWLLRDIIALTSRHFQIMRQTS